MAIYKPPKLKNAKEFLTDKKVNRSSPEEYYEVTSQKFSLYDPDTAYSGSQRAKQEKESEKRLSLPKVNLQELRDNSINQFTEYLPREEVSRLNRIAHQGEQPKKSLIERLTSNVTDENRATLGVQKKPSAPRVNSQVATLAGKQPEQYSQQQSAEGDRFQSDGNITGQVASTEPKKESEPIDWENQLRGAGRSLIDLPRNIGAAAVNTYDNLRKSGILPGGAQKQKVLTEEEFNNSNALTKKGYGTYENYLKLVGGLNESPQFASSEKTDKVVEGLQEKLPSKVDSDTTLWEKMVRGAATSWLPSMASASLGGGLAGMAGQFSSNPIIIEAMRTAPLFTSGTDSGLKTAEELGLTGAKKYSYAVLSGLLEAGTERLSSLGLEGKLLGKKTSGGVGGTKEFLRAIFEESGSEMLNEVGQQLLTGQYTNYEDFELDFENIIVAGGSAALMGGFGAVGELSNGMKYRTVGTVDNQVIIETEDGRRENVNPEIVMRHQLANGRTARMAQEMLKADTEIQELAKTFVEQEQIAATIPVEDTTTPQEQFEVETELSMPVEERPLTEPLNEQKEESVAKERGSNIENLKVNDIGVDAKRFQFKESTDSNTGAGTSLQGTDTFNPNLAGVVTVWRDNNGKDWIINGHHRLELARRSNTNNIDARILYESDGVTESLARQIGAEQNIAEGKGSAKDAAQIFRESGYTVKELAELGLSIKDKFIEQAYNISKLNDRLWDKVVTKQLKETQASMIGEAFPNDSDKQNAVMDYINEEGYITDKELKEVIDGVRFSETNYEEQYTLMGLETVAKSNFKEKVKLTTKIKQSIGSEKSAFSKLVKAQSAKKIEDAGNILNQEANESRLDLLQNINEIIDFGKNRQGDPINIIINKYANEVQNGAKLNFAADKAIEEITAIVQDGGYIALAMRGIEEQSNQQMMIGDEINETQQNEPGNVEGINQGSERTEIEGQGSLFDITESENTATEEVNTASEREPLETRLDNMISKNLIDSPNNRRVATNLNQKIVELGGQDRLEEIEPKKAEERENTVTLPANTIRRLNGNSMFNRGNAIQSDANTQLNEFERKFGNLKDLNAEQTEYLEERKAEYEKMVRDLYSQYADKESRHVSWAVTGRSNYPAAKMNKIMEQNIRFSEEMSEKFNRFMENTSKYLKTLMSDEDQIQRFREGKWTSGESIDAADPLAIQKYEAKLEYLKGNQEKMKAANREAMKAGKDRAYPPYALTNNNANIKSTEQMLNKLKTRADSGTVEDGPVFGGGHVVFNNEADRLQIFFDEKPSEEIRDILKKNGFKYSPKNNDAWQRQLTGNARYALKKILPQISTEPLDTDIVSSDDDLMVNNMAMEAEIEPMEQATREEVASMTDFDLMDEYRESKTKQSMQNSKFSERTKKIAENVDYFYKTVTFKGESLKSREQITGRVEAELARLETMDKENARFTASDTSDAIMILELSDNLLNETGDAYWAGVIERAEVMRKKILSNFGQGLVMGKMTKPLSPRGTLIALDTDVTTTMTPAQKKGAEKINKEMTDILTDVPTENGRIKLDATEIDSFVDTIMERFPNMKKNWGKQWKKQLAEGNVTKAEILDSIYRASGVPRLSVEAKAEILEHLEAMSKLEQDSTEYNIHNNEIKSTIRHSRGIGFWTKLSALQTYAMLGNAKTGLKNELGNWIGFSMGQFDAEYSEFFDKQYAKTTGQRTVADRGKGIEYAKGYKEGVKRSFQDFKDKADSRQNSSKYFDDNVGRVFKHQNGGYARILVDLVSGDNKVDAAKQFATHSAAKAENLTKFIVDDRRHAFARYEMSRAAIEVTDATIKETNKGLPKEQQVVFSKEEALANLEKEIAYYTFNNKTAGAKILTDAVKALNKFSTRGATTEFGAGTLLAKFTKTPMNIIAFTTDHLGWDYATARRQYKESYKELKKTLPKPEAKKEAIQLNQRELATSKAKALTGATFIGTGMMLAALGGITPNRDDEDERLLLEAQGYKSGYLNMSGLVRNLLGGGNDKVVYDYGTGDVQDGDTLISINQFAPGGAFMLLGARIMDYMTAEEADKSFRNILAATLQGAIDSSTDLVDLPFNRTASMIINEFKYADYKEGGTSEALMNVGNKLLGSMATSFIPAPVKQTSQLLDPYAKSYSRDSGEAVKEQIMANVPTLRDDVPYAFYVNGEPIQYSGEKNAIEALWSAYAAPYYKSVVKYDKPLKSITDSVAKNKVSPPTLAPNKITYSGSEYNLSKEERQEYQKAYWKTYEKTRDTKKASTSAKIDYFKRNKIKFELDKNGDLKKIK